MFVTRIIVVVLLYEISVIRGKELHPLSDEFIDLINKEGKWTAGRNFHPDTAMEQLKRLGSAHLNLADYKKLPVKKHDKALLDVLPESFDPREQWPNCPSINEIRDQARCGACWAFGAVEAMTDRVCIFSNGTKNFHFSAEDLVACHSGYSGCEGGNPIIAWSQWVVDGFVSGGNYNSHEGCKPYSFPPCPNHLKNCIKFLPTPPCNLTCEEGYTKDYKADKKRGKDFYIMEGEQQIMAELYKNGPVEATFIVYEDFADYKSGVYQYVKGNVIFGHAVKMLGWGVENGTKYWLAANSWGPSFGENGYFKILRGENHCYIESFVIAGTPLLDDF